MRNLFGRNMRGMKNLKEYGQAADRTQAVLELAPDGTVAAANDRFLMLTGYALDDIKGRHHRDRKSVV